MDHDEFYTVFREQVKLCEEVLIAKSAEYSEEGDKLHNFRVAAELQGMDMREALGGMMAKHIVSIYDLINREELADMHIWNEKIGDALNYLFLLKAIVVEEASANEENPLLDEMFRFINNQSVLYRCSNCRGWFAKNDMLFVGHNLCKTCSKKEETRGD